MTDAVAAPARPERRISLPSFVPRVRDVQELWRQGAAVAAFLIQPENSKAQARSFPIAQSLRRAAISFEPAPKDSDGRADILEGLFDGGQGRRMYYRYQPPAQGRPTYVIIHGIGDESSNWKSVAGLLAQSGAGTLQIDLHGHGKTLEVQERSGYRHEEQVEDIEGLIQKLNPPAKIRLVGHSYGAAIALSLGGRPSLWNRVESIYAVTPYLGRLDLHILRQLSRLNNWTFLAGRILESVVSKAALDAILTPLDVAVMRAVAKPRLFAKLGATQRSATADEKNWVDTQLRAIVGVALGSGSFDAAVALRELPGGLALRVVLAGKDQLLPSGYHQSFLRSAAAAGKAVEPVVVPEATHFLPTEDPRRFVGLLEPALLD